MSSDPQQGLLERTPDEKDQLIAHFRKQADFAIARMAEAQEVADRVRWHANSDRLLVECWHAINDDVDDYLALCRVSDLIEEHLGYHGQRCAGCGKAALEDMEGEDPFVYADWCKACEDRKHQQLLDTLGVV